MRKLKKLFSFTNGFKYYKMKVHDAKSVLHAYLEKTMILAGGQP